MDVLLTRLYLICTYFFEIIAIHHIFKLFPYERFSLPHMAFVRRLPSLDPAVC